MKDKYGIEYIVTEHDTLVESDNITEYERNNLRRIYAGAMKRIAVSSAFAEKLHSIYDVDFDVVYNVLDMSAFGNVEKVPHDGFNFVSVGNLFERKGFAELIEAFSELPADAKLYIIGNGPQDKLLKSMVDERGIQEKVLFVGQKSRMEIAEYMSIADCFVLASKKETFGVVYIEAMACGVPVIATRCGGPHDFVFEHNGILVDVDDIEALKNAMQYMIENREQYDDEKIRKFCFDTFSDVAFVDRIVNLMGEPLMSEIQR